METAASHRRLLVIFNPVAGRRQRGRLETVLSELRRLSCEVYVCETRGQEDALGFGRLGAKSDVELSSMAKQPTLKPP